LPNFFPSDSVLSKCIALASSVDDENLQIRLTGAQASSLAVSAQARIVSFQK